MQKLLVAAVQIGSINEHPSRFQFFKAVCITLIQYEIFTLDFDLMLCHRIFYFVSFIIVINYTSVD
jgi:hypothetical protein